VTAIGTWLLVIGLCDLVRAARDATPWSRRLLLTGLGVLLLVGAWVALQPPWWVPLLWLATFVVWAQASAVALVTRSAAARAAAFTGLAVGLVGSLLAGDAVAAPARELPGPIGELGVEVVLTVTGVLLAQLSTANIVVRLTLDAVGVPAADNEKTLKGGRLLGPMERLMVVGLGIAGELTAAGIVVAAKGLLRFPELQRGTRSGPSDMTEYFLIGSFASWLLALGGVVLCLLP
jgi:hypothetical protein